MPFVVGMVNGKPQVCLTSAAIGDATIGNTHIDDKGLSANHITSGTLRANTKLTIGNFHFVLETLRENDGSYGRLVVYDKNGHPRVTLGRMGNDFGLQVVDGNGNVQFDANGPRVTIDQAFIEDLYLGGFKATVPGSSFVQSSISIPIVKNPPANAFFVMAFDKNVHTLLNTLYYDPQGCSSCNVTISFSFAGIGDWSDRYLPGSYHYESHNPRYTVFALEVQASSTTGYNSGAKIWSNDSAIIFENNTIDDNYNNIEGSSRLRHASFSASFLTTRLDPSKGTHINAFLTPSALSANFSRPYLMPKMGPSPAGQWGIVWNRDITVFGTR